MLDQEEEVALNEFQKLEDKLSAKQGEKDSRCVWGRAIPAVSMELTGDNSMAQYMSV